MIKGDLNYGQFDFDKINQYLKSKNSLIEP